MDRTVNFSKGLDCHRTEKDEKDTGLRDLIYFDFKASPHEPALWEVLLFPL